MAPARAFWKGHLKLSLVSCPIALYNGTSAISPTNHRRSAFTPCPTERRTSR